MNVWFGCRRVFGREPPSHSFWKPSWPCYLCKYDSVLDDLHGRLSETKSAMVAFLIFQRTRLLSDAPTAIPRKYPKICRMRHTTMYGRFEIWSEHYPFLYNNEQIVIQCGSIIFYHVVIFYHYFILFIKLFCYFYRYSKFIPFCITNRIYWLLYN